MIDIDNTREDPFNGNESPAFDFKNHKNVASNAKVPVRPTLI